MKAIRNSKLAMVSAALVACAATLLAQYQVNRQLYSSAPASGSVRYAPQYLGVQASAPSSARLLDSEVRNAYARSGAMPSDIRMGYNKVGPLSPTGPVAYIPQTPTYRANPGAMPNGNYLGVQNVGSLPNTTNSIYGAQSTTANSVRYGGNPSINALNAASLNAAAGTRSSAAPSSSSGSMNPMRSSSSSGSIRYGG